MSLVLLLVVLLVSTSVWGEQGAKPSRLAILIRDPKLMTLGDLLTANLTKNNNLELMDRAEIDRVLKEQALSLGSIQGTMQAGQLLGADGLLICEVKEVKGENQLVARLVAVKPGVVLTLYSKVMAKLDSLNKEFDYAGVANELLGQITPYFSKLEIAASQAIPLSLLNLRATASTPDALQMEQTLNAMLLERLATDPSLLILERRQLDSLTWEKELMDVADSPFWNGSFILEGSIDPQELSQKEVTIVCQLRTKNRAEPISVRVTGPRDRPFMAINDLVRKILAELKKETVATAWSAEQESKRYLEEAKWAYRWKVYREAQAAAESSWALGLHTQEVEVLRVFTYADAARTIEFEWATDLDGTLTISNPPDPGKLSPARRSLELVRDGTLARRATGQPVGYEWYGVSTEIIYNSARLLRHFWLRPPAERLALAKELQQLREEIRQTVELLERDPLVREPDWLNYARNISPPSPIFKFNSPRNLHFVKYYYGVFWQETSEQAIAMYRTLLTGPARATLIHDAFRRDEMNPNLIDWQRYSTNELDQHWQAFADELRTSKEIPEQMLGIVLDAQGIHTRFSMPEPEVWRNGRLILAASDNYRGPLASETGAALSMAIEKVFLRLDTLIDNARENKASVPALQSLRDQLAVISQKIGAAQTKKNMAERARERELEEQEQQAKKLQQEKEATQARDQRLEDYRQLLATAKPADAVRLLMVFFDHVHNKEEALKILPAVEEYNERSGQTANTKSLLLRAKTISGWRDPKAIQLPKPPPLTNAATTNFARIVKLLPTDITLTARHFETLPITTPKGYFIENYQLISLKYREGKLWVEMDADCYEEHGYVTPLETVQQSYIVAVDLKTGGKAIYPLHYTRREGMEGVNDRLERERTFEIHLGKLYYTEKGHLVEVNTATKESRRIPIPIEWRASIFSVSTNLYLTTDDSILEYNPKSEALRTLVSTRRRPETTFLDRLPRIYFPPITTGPNGRIRTALQQRVYECDLATGEWKELPGIQGGIMDLRTAQTEDPMLISDGRGVMGVSSSRSEPRLLFILKTKHYSIPIMGGAQAKDMPVWRVFLDTPSWDTPTCFAQWDGADIWVRTGLLKGLPKSAFQLDHRQLDQVKVGFSYVAESAAAKSTLKPRSSYEEKHSIFVAAPEGLILTTERAAGYWFIPRNEVETALALSRQPMTKALAAFDAEESDLYDLNRNGHLEPEEEQSMKQSMEHYYAAARLNMNLWIQHFDTNGDDQLDQTELSNLLTTDPLLPKPFVSRIQNGRNKMMDVNSNGKFDIQELWMEIQDQVMRESYYRPAPTSRPRTKYQ